MSATGSGLKTPSTPQGILHLEFANTPSKAAIVLKAWEDNLIMTAKINTYWDFVFLLFYSFLFYNLCKWINHLLPNSKYGSLGILFAKLSILTGILDVMENIFMLSVLSKTYNSIQLIIMSCASYIKWALVVAIIIYCIIGLALFAFKKTKKI